MVTERGVPCVCYRVFGSGLWGDVGARGPGLSLCVSGHSEEGSPGEPEGQGLWTSDKSTHVSELGLCLSNGNGDTCLLSLSRR